MERRSHRGFAQRTQSHLPLGVGRPAHPARYAQEPGRHSPRRGPGRVSAPGEPRRVRAVGQAPDGRGIHAASPERGSPTVAGRRLYVHLWPTRCQRARDGCATLRHVPADAGPRRDLAGDDPRDGRHCLQGSDGTGHPGRGVQLGRDRGTSAAHGDRLSGRTGRLRCPGLWHPVLPGAPEAHRGSGSGVDRGQLPVEGPHGALCRCGACGLRGGPIRHGHYSGRAQLQLCPLLARMSREHQGADLSGACPNHCSGRLLNRQLPRGVVPL